MLLINHLHRHCHYHASFLLLFLSSISFSVLPLIPSPSSRLSFLSLFWPFIIFLLCLHSVSFLLDLFSFFLLSAFPPFVLSSISSSSSSPYLIHNFFIYYSFPYSFFHPSTLPSFLFFCLFPSLILPSAVFPVLPFTSF